MISNDGVLANPACYARAALEPEQARRGRGGHGHGHGSHFDCTLLVALKLIPLVQFYLLI